VGAFTGCAEGETARMARVNCQARSGNNGVSFPGLLSDLGQRGKHLASVDVLEVIRVLLALFRGEMTSCQVKT